MSWLDYLPVPGGDEWLPVHYIIFVRYFNISFFLLLLNIFDKDHILTKHRYQNQ